MKCIVLFSNTFTKMLLIVDMGSLYNHRRKLLTSFTAPDVKCAYLLTVSVHVSETV